MIYRATAVLPRRTGVAADNVHNTFHVTTPGGSSASDADDIADAIQLFYNEIAVHIGSQVTRAALACQIKVAALTIGSPGADDDSLTSPLAEKSFTMGAVSGTGTNLPSDVAAVLTIRGDVTNQPVQVGSVDNPPITRPRSRRMGRLYLGPLSNQAVDTDASTFEIKPGATFRTDVFDGIQAMVDSLALWGAIWGVYSRVNGILYPVLDIAMDNELDTQRRRGPRPSSKTLYTLT